MAHALIYSNGYKRNGREEVLVLDAGAGKELHLHRGMNATSAELWAAAKTGERAKALLAQGVLVDKGLAPEPKEEAPAPVAEEHANVEEQA